jgi:hypothetical protein
MNTARRSAKRKDFASGAALKKALGASQLKKALEASQDKGIPAASRKCAGGEYRMEIME